MFNKEEYGKKWREDNPNYNRKKYEENREILLEYSKKYHKENRERILKQKREYYFNNKEKYLRYAEKKQKENPRYMAEYQKKWRSKNPEYANNWVKTKKGRANAQRANSKRRAREKEIINTLTSQEWLDILKEHKYKCFYCGKEFEIENMPQKDHITPINKGGNNTKENVVPACRSCNSKKGDKIMRIP